MRKIPGIRFSHVLLAGSPLPRTYDWNEIIIERKQVLSLRNERSVNDTVIAYLASALSFFSKDLGTAGIYGFDGDVEGKQEVCYFYGGRTDGGHGRPLEDDNLDNIVDFILSDTPCALPEDKLHTEAELASILNRHKFGSRLAYFVMPLLILIICLTVYLGWKLHCPWMVLMFWVFVAFYMKVF